MESVTKSVVDILNFDFSDSSEGMTDDFITSSTCSRSDDTLSSPQLRAVHPAEDWDSLKTASTEAPPLISQKSWGMSAIVSPQSQAKAKHFFTAENITHSLMSPDTPEDSEKAVGPNLASVLQPFMDQSTTNNNSNSNSNTIDMQPPPLLHSMPPPLEPRSHHQSPTMNGDTTVNSSIAGYSGTLSSTPSSPLLPTQSMQQGLTEDESDEIRRKLVTAHLVQMHVARNNMAARFAAQQLQSSYQQSTMRDDELDINRVDPELYKVKMCRNMNRTGVCGYGYLCVFAHQLSDLRSRETNIDVLKRLYADGKPNVNPLKYKVRSCQKFIEQGSCPYEPHCVFAHGPAELRTMEQNMQAVQRIQQICQATGVNYAQRLQLQEQQQQAQQQHLEQDMLQTEPPPLTPFC